MTKSPELKLFTLNLLVGTLVVLVQRNACSPPMQSCDPLLGELLLANSRWQRPPQGSRVSTGFLPSAMDGGGVRRSVGREGLLP